MYQQLSALPVGLGAGRRSRTAPSSCDSSQAPLDARAFDIQLVAKGDRRLCHRGIGRDNERLQARVKVLYLADCSRTDSALTWAGGSRAPKKGPRGDKKGTTPLAPSAIQRGRLTPSSRRLFGESLPEDPNQRYVVATSLRKGFSQMVLDRAWGGLLAASLALRPVGRG